MKRSYEDRCTSEKTSKCDAGKSKEKSSNVDRCTSEKTSKCDAGKSKEKSSNVEELMDLAANTAPLKSLILNTSEPIVLKDMLHWNILDWNKNKWEEVLNSESLEFRIGKNYHTNIPQWETTTAIVHGKFSDIFTYSSTNSEEWIYFDYKYLKHHLLHFKELRENISWHAFGLDEVTVDDCTLWIGSRGAHTSLHVDTYGCNIVAQIYGRKLWVLFPPDTDLKETRIPYEESSIFSQYNLFSPNVDSMKDIKNCRKIVLNPGEVLVLPCMWWHYVENLEPAISINAWIPLPQDNVQRLRESITQMLMSQITCSLPDEMKKQIINPSMMTNIMADNPYDAFHTIDLCKDICLMKDSSKTETTPGVTTMHLEVHNKNCAIQKIPSLTQEEYIDFLKSQAKRIPENHATESSKDLNVLSNIIKTVTDSDVISLIANKLLHK